VPLGGGKVQVGSSTKLGKEAVVTEKSWDVVVIMDDGKPRVVTVSQQPNFAEGDRVRVDGTQIVPLGPTESSTALPQLSTQKERSSAPAQQ
jgi:hypothetical protein